MSTPIRVSVVVIALIAVLLAAFSLASASTPEQPSTPAPSAPAQDGGDEAGDDAAGGTSDLVGVITVVNGGAVGGPGLDLMDAVSNPSSEPRLVNGVLFRDTDGTLYLAGGLADASVPTFHGPLLRVVDHPHSQAQWDPANAEITGLQEANGVLFFEGHQLFGVIGS